MNADALADLFGTLLRGIPALPSAACRDPAHRGSFDSVDPADIVQAVEVCADCPDRKPCSQWAAGQPPRTLLGVIAGKFYTYDFRYTKKENKKR